MGDDNVKLSIKSTQFLSFAKGDKILVDGQEYSIRTKVNREILADNIYSYEAVFYGVMYELMKSQYRNTDANGKSTKSTFDLTYSLKDFIKVVIYNVNRDYPGIWRFDEENCPDTEPKTLQFSRKNCLQVLQTACKEWKYEFRIVQEDGIRTIQIGKFGTKITPPGGKDFFEWGKGNGLFKLKEQKVDDKSIITRLWVEGGTQNLRSDYRDYSDRLQLPYPKRLNQREHTLSDGTVIPPLSEYIGIDNDNDRYMEDPDLRDTIGSDEDTEYYDAIYPKRTGEVTALGSDIYSFVDNTMDFDLNEKDSEGTKYLINGVTAKLTFITGKLAGQQFELKEKGGYNHSTKTFSIIKYTDERGLSIPTEDSEAFRIMVGDKYKITDINLPKSYEDNAEEDLWYAGYDDFKDRKQMRALYVLTFDRSYFINTLPSDSRTKVFDCGDYVPVKDERFNLEKNIRIQKMSRNLLIDHDYTLTLSDTTTISIQTQTVLDVIEHNIIIDNHRLRDLNKARRGWRTTEELRNMVYDTDGYFDVDNIKPNSIDTNMLTVGSKSQQFVLIDTILQANVNGYPNRFEATAGILAHLSINDTIIRQWNMSAASVTLSEAGGYYVFAKCSKDGSSGVYYITQEQIKVEPVSDPNNYYFQVGIIGSLHPDDGFRDFTTTYGFTRINGNTITTGKIVTSDGECYLDLDGNKFRIGDATSSIDWNVTARNQLTLKNVKLQSGSGDLSDIGVYRGVYNSAYIYYRGDEVSYTVNGETCTYRYTNPTPGKGNPPTNSVYWSVVAKGQSGKDGENGVPGKDGVDGKTTYFHIKYSAVGNPTSSSQMSEVPNTYIGTYVDYTEADSNDPKKYTWARFQGLQGEDGENGIPGVNGENGETSYLHIKYSDDGGLTFTDNNGETAGSWIGQYTDFNIKDSDLTTAYTWSRIKGEDGTPGSSGIDGVDGDFYEYRYAKNTSETTPPALDKNADVPTGWSLNMPSVSDGEYIWSIISKKSKVLNSSLMYLPVTDADSRTIADASGNGNNATLSGSNVAAISDSARGKVLKFDGVSNCIAPLELPFDSDFTLCIWLKPKSSKISWMVNCTNGREYVENHIEVTANKWVHFTFRKNDKTITVFKDGVEISRNSTNNDHVGFSVYDDNMFGTFAEMDEIRLFKSALSADQIESVKDGSITSMIEKWSTPVRVNAWDGDYFEYRYAKNGSTTTPPALTATAVNPSGWSTTMPTTGALEYLWCTVAKKSAAGALMQNWSTPVRIKGADGAKGDKGDKGENPVLVFRGIYDSSKTYYGTNSRLDAVKYNGQYYIARIDGGTITGSGKAPTNTTYWNTFGAEFETIATNLLLAEGANIGDWFMSGGKIVSTLSGSNKITLDASMARIFVESVSSGGDHSLITGLGSKITIDANGGVVRVQAATSPGYSTGTAYMSPTGIFANLAGTDAMPASSGYTHRGAIVGLGFANVAKNAWATNVVDTIVAGVYGRASNNGTAPAYGGFFYDLYAGGLTLGRKAITTASTSTYLNSSDTLVIGYTSNSNQIVYLPTSPKEGQIVFFKQWWTGSMRVYPRTGQVLYDDSSENSYYDVSEGQMMIAVFTIGYVNSVKKEAWLVSRFKY
ncbi:MULTISPECIES: LamG-like jellyroll fold domain-containing protein [unclassified Dysgonomonas]|uniref:LamG-like jellyroll fold domain-containing protein n=1 Tax=unclassified Dysgonomonas TaxID=2630389 RepID=UPI0024764499|nr:MULTISPECIES: LamG-like jellyroll fold domain-containing protein [unclassified Dysgonomonas]